MLVLALTISPLIVAFKYVNYFDFALTGSNKLLNLSDEDPGVKEESPSVVSTKNMLCRHVPKYKVNATDCKYFMYDPLLQ